MLLIQSFNSSKGLISLLAYLGGLFIFWTGAFFILYHLIRFGVGTKPKQMAFVFLIGSIVLSLIVTMLFIRLNWGNFTQPLVGY